ncbi:hypothetical protein AAY473_006736 [Plecturocebus cupreus]
MQFYIVIQELLTPLTMVTQENYKMGRAQWLTPVIPALWEAEADQHFFCPHPLLTDAQPLLASCQETRWELLKNNHSTAAQKSSVDLEGRVFSGCPNQSDRPTFHVRKESVLIMGGKQKKVIPVNSHLQNPIPHLWTRHCPSVGCVCAPGPSYPGEPGGFSGASIPGYRTASGIHSQDNYGSPAAKAALTLPQPGGPHRMSEGISLVSKSERSRVSWPTALLCPKVSGRILSASGLPSSICRISSAASARGCGRPPPVAPKAAAAASAASASQCPGSSSPSASASPSPSPSPTASSSSCASASSQLCGDALPAAAAAAGLFPDPFLPGLLERGTGKSGMRRAPLGVGGAS